MANELALNISLGFSKGGLSLSRGEGITVTVAGDAFSHEVQSIPTSNTVLAVGAAVGTVGYVFIKNLDATNFVSIGLTGSYTIKLKAGEIALFRAAGALYALADTAACLVEYIFFEL